MSTHNLCDREIKKIIELPIKPKFNSVKVGFDGV